MEELRPHTPYFPPSTQPHASSIKLQIWAAYFWDSTSHNSLQVIADSLNILKTSPTAGCELTLAQAHGRQKTWLTANSALPYMQNDILALGT